jgi:hypothetical protein
MTVDAAVIFVFQATGLRGNAATAHAFAMAGEAALTVVHDTSVASFQFVGVVAGGTAQFFFVVFVLASLKTLAQVHLLDVVDRLVVFAGFRGVDEHGPEFS